MERKHFKILIKGHAVEKHRIVLNDFITITGNVQKAIISIAQNIVEIQGEQSNRFKKDVAENCQLELIGILSGSLGIELGFREMDTDRSSNYNLGEQSLQLLLDGLQDINKAQIKMSEIFDKKVIKNILEIRKVFKNGIDEIEFSSQFQDKRKSIILDFKMIGEIENLIRKTESVEEQEIFGILWEANWKNHTAELYTNIGKKVIVKFDETFDNKIKEAARTRVKLKGKIKFENNQPKEIELKEIQFIRSKSIFEDSELLYVSEPSAQHTKTNPFSNVKPVSNMSFFDELPDDWDVDDFVQTVYRMREEDKD